MKYLFHNRSICSLLIDSVLFSFCKQEVTVNSIYYYEDFSQEGIRGSWMWSGKGEVL